MRQCCLDWVIRFFISLLQYRYVMYLLLLFEFLIQDFYLFYSLAFDLVDIEVNVVTRYIIKNNLLNRWRWWLIISQTASYAGHLCLNSIWNKSAIRIPFTVAVVYAWQGFIINDSAVASLYHASDMIFLYLLQILLSVLPFAWQVMCFEFFVLFDGARMLIQLV